jgi:hypothetical protein
MQSPSQPSIDLDPNRDQDFAHKITIVLNKHLESWEAFNAATHIAAYIGNRLGDNFATGPSFTTQDGVLHPRNSQFAIIILRAKPTQLHGLMAKTRDSGLLYHGFFREMIETTSDQEIETMLSTKLDTDLEYLGIGLFGDTNQVDTLTKSYQVWR